MRRLRSFVLALGLLTTAGCWTTAVFMGTGGARKPCPLERVAMLQCPPHRRFADLGTIYGELSSLMPVQRQLRPLDDEAARAKAAEVGCDALVSTAGSTRCPARERTVEGQFRCIVFLDPPEAPVSPGAP